ncbi:MAG: IPT/TIG domain-containing protein [bacterium]|nr:IPT/TIG domain-containing protein [bacterium]
MKKALIILAQVMLMLALTGVAHALPSSVIISNDLPPIGDQGTIGQEDMQCQLWAASYYMLTHYIKHFEHPEWDLTNPQYQFSPTFLALAPPPTTAIEKLQVAGCVDLAEVPYDANHAPPLTSTQIEAAKPYRITGADTLWDYTTISNPAPPYSTSQESILSAKTYLASGHVLDVGIKASHKDFPDRYGTNATFYFDPTYTTGEVLGVGHQVAFCGYDDNINPTGVGADHQGGFLMVNEAGTNWNGAMHGFLWMSYAYVKQYVCVCSAITGIVSDLPLIVGCDKYAGKVGDVVTITGDSFGGERRATKVTFNGIVATNVIFSNNSIATLVPFGATSGQLVVHNWEGTPSNGIEFQVVPEPAMLGLLSLCGGLLLRRK